MNEGIVRESVAELAADVAGKLACPEHVQSPAFAETDSATDVPATVVTTGLNVR